ncbi:multidrug DMT transporter permease [Rhodanobacter sp. Soil772]|nr:multidrug DMT transporter permease [Rhodanobacter sp. Soil772]
MPQRDNPALSLNGESLPPRTYAWMVFALTFALLLSDYMSRQVLNAVFPLLKMEWGVSDAKLGGLSSVVALTVGLLTLPLSLLADRYGRIRCLVTMALLWSLATLACGFARTYEEMLIARFFVGLGEAAYGAVGLAVALSVFPVHMRATITGAFMAGGLFGSVLGIASGGAIAAHFGWRVAFYAMAAFGLVFAVIYPFVVRERRMARAPSGASARAASGPTTSLRNLFTNPVLLCLYAASGVQMFLPSALMAWTPSYMVRYYGMQTAQAASFAAILVLCGGVGMVVLGIVSDRKSRAAPASGQQVRLAMIYCAVSAVSLFIAFALPPGPVQLGFIALGFFFSAGMAGPTGSMVTQLSHVSFHATALAVLTLVNNILGLAPGPFVTGVIADHIGLRNALLIMPVMGLMAIFLYRLALSLWRQHSGKPHAIDGIA